ncbi:MAG TPA: dihydroxyacetone kinase subunit DhaL [Actinomycetota bacterium]|nr:dihydroxyacetone kinase subunit DhaL [Actinomycetota bacterium]
MSVSYDLVVRFVRGFARAIEENRDHLTELDSPIGDADHGINMHRGMQAALAKLDGLAAGDIGALLRTVGMTLVSTVGGAGGPLYGTLFMQMGMATSGKDELSPRDWAEAFDRGLRGVVNLGKAEPGDKTMVDALTPARDALERALDEGAPFGEALRRAAAAAEEGMKATIPMVARKGRASYLGERSAGHQDPGATSSYLLVRAAADAWSDADP